MSNLLKGIILSALVVISGCSGQRVQDAGTNTIGSLDLSPEPIVRNPVSAPTPAELKQQYSQLLNLIDDESLRINVLNRIAQLELMQSELAHEMGQALSDTRQGYYDDAIAIYSQLVETQTDAKNYPQWLYQLAKAYELQGQIDQSLALLERLVNQYPEFQYLAEVQFRRGEMFYSAQQYERAISAYQGAASRPDDNRYYALATYMRGWSQFKLERYSDALVAFSQVLDFYLPDWIYSGEVKGDERLSHLQIGDQKLIDDTVRIMSLVFSYSDGVEAISELFARIGERHYEPLLYDALGQLYINKDRYRDSARVYQQFVSSHPASLDAPEFFVKRIDAYLLGEFPSLLLPAKIEFVQTYGIAGPFWAEWREDQRARVKPYLLVYLTELAAYQHSLAQKQYRVFMQTEDANSKTTDANSELNQTQETHIESDEKTLTKQAVVANFKRAANWYRQLIATFPEDPQRADITFSLAESLQQANEYQQAIIEFENVAYGYPDYQQSALRNSAEAAYAAIVVYDSWLEAISAGMGIPEVVDIETTFNPNKEESADAHKEANDGDATKQSRVISINSAATGESGIYHAVLRAKLDSQAQFIAQFSGDPRASNVLYDLIQQQYQLALHAPITQRFQPGFESGEASDAMLAGKIYSDYYYQAIKHAKMLLSWQPEVAVYQQFGAWLVVGHSEFTLTNYVAAEQAYDNLLALMQVHDFVSDSITTTEILDRLAASLYQQAQMSLSAGDKLQAVALLQRVITKAPNSRIRINAQFDAATYLLELQDWTGSINLLTDFRQRFATHELVEQIPVKLALAYQQTQQWQLAADELVIIYQQDTDPESQRQALLSAAELYDKAGNRARALDNFRTYAHQYPLPFATAMEVRFKMSEFYLASREDSKRRYWLNKIIKADADAGAMRTPRSISLAAMASLVFANDARLAFNKIKLKLPLQQSLAKKSKALEKALDAYTRTASYQIEEYTTESTYRIGEIYAQLARDLLDSDRPEDLNALELEQYEILLEEQAFPFEDKAISIHETNSRRSWQGIYDHWVKDSFIALKKLLPGRYNKTERHVEVTDALH